MEIENHFTTEEFPPHIEDIHQEGHLSQEGHPSQERPPA